MVNKKRIVIFLSTAFGFSWVIGLAIFLTGGLSGSPELIPNSGITLAIILLASGYMWGPALAHVLTRFVTGAGWKNLYLKPSIKQRWRFLLAGWFLPGILTIFGTVLFFFCFPGLFDGRISLVKEQMAAIGAPAAISPAIFVFIQTLFALFISAPLNIAATFGEEFGWRAFLLPELMPLGKRKALLLSSIIWGVWHWPVVLMGHNYGLSYAGYPWLGLIATLWFTISAGVFFGWLSLEGKSVWPAVLAHGSLNGLASIGSLFLTSQPPLLLGPTPAGIIGCLPFTIISIIILLKAPTGEQNPTL